MTAAGGVSKAVASAVRVLTEQGLLGKVKIELETRTQDEVKEALTLSGVDQLMLDNMVCLICLSTLSSLSTLSCLTVCLAWFDFVLFFPPLLEPRKHKHR